MASHWDLISRHAAVHCLTTMELWGTPRKGDTRHYGCSIIVPVPLGSRTFVVWHGREAGVCMPTVWAWGGGHHHSTQRGEPLYPFSSFFILHRGCGVSCSPFSTGESYSPNFDHAGGRTSHPQCSLHCSLFTSQCDVCEKSCNALLGRSLLVFETMLHCEARCKEKYCQSKPSGRGYKRIHCSATNNEITAQQVQVQVLFSCSMQSACSVYMYLVVKVTSASMQGE